MPEVVVAHKRDDVRYGIRGALVEDVPAVWEEGEDLLAVGGGEAFPGGLMGEYILFRVSTGSYGRRHSRTKEISVPEDFLLCIVSCERGGA